MNKVILIGNLGQDAELKSIPSGESVANFSIATTERWKSKDGNKQERTEWHSCSLWGKVATSLAPYLKKGTKVSVEGSINYQKYEKDNETRYSTRIKVNNVELLGSLNRDVSQKSEPQTTQNAPTADDIPF